MTTKYGLATFSADGFQEAVGLVIDDEIYPLAALAGPEDGLAADSMLSLLESWDTSLPQLNRLADAARTAGVRPISLAAAHIHPPVPRPRQIFCTGANYRKHVVDLTMDMQVGPEGVRDDALRRWAEEMMDERAAHGEPYVFTKPVTALAGPNDPLILPATTTKPDWEVELCAVIGRGGYQISREDAVSHVAGYAIVNDISARDLIPRTDYAMLGTDWLKSKGQPGFLPFGPYIVPAGFVRDPQNLSLKLSLNEKIMQDESSADMIFGVAQQIEYISAYARLLPGDLICTGSPAGNGTHYGRFLRPGDEMVAQIEGLGVQRVRCVAPNG